MIDRAAKAREVLAAYLLPAEPLRRWLDARPESAESLGRRAGVGPRTLRRIRSGEQARVSVRYADSFLSGLGLRLADLWEPETVESRCSLCGDPVVRMTSPAFGTVVVFDQDGQTDHAETCVHGAIPTAVAA